MSDVKRRPLMDMDEWAASQMPEFQRTMTPHLDFAPCVFRPHMPHQYYASDVTQNVFAGWLAARRGLVEVGAVEGGGAWPKCPLNAAGRELKAGTRVYALQRQVMGYGVAA